jgi:hypothetical protein
MKLFNEINWPETLEDLLEKQWDLENELIYTKLDGILLFNHKI